MVFFKSLFMLSDQNPDYWTGLFELRVFEHSRGRVWYFHNGQNAKHHGVPCLQYSAHMSSLFREECFTRSSCKHYAGRRVVAGRRLQLPRPTGWRRQMPHRWKPWLYMRPGQDVNFRPRYDLIEQNAPSMRDTNKQAFTNQFMTESRTYTERNTSPLKYSEPM